MTFRIAVRGSKITTRPILAAILGGVFLFGNTAHSAPAGYATQQNPQSGTVSNVNINLRYAAFSHGYHALNIDANYTLQPWGYAAETHLYTAGIASWFLSLNLLSHAEGHIFQHDISPTFFHTQGTSHGEKHLTHLTYDLHGPHVATLLPTEEGREELSITDQRQAIDILSFFVSLIHQINTTQNCLPRTFLFDGVRLSLVDMQSPVPDVVPQKHHSVYKGQALRCDFTGRQTGGFSIGSPHKALKSAPHQGRIWFAPMHGAGFVPVRLEFDHPKLGLMTIVLQSSPHIINLNNVPKR